MTSVLEQLKTMTTVVADTGDLAAVRKFKPRDCTTNPSLVLAALEDPASEYLVSKELKASRQTGKSAEDAAATLTVAIGAELAKLVPGRVSTEVDARLSFDTEASIGRAHEIIADYENRGVGKERILIKLAATWEGIRAAEILQHEGIDCNLTLLFSMAQAIACADAGAYLISPFVGRITDWHKKTDGVESYTDETDPGVASVRHIFDYYKSNDIDTIVMGASFRNTDQIKALAGCDNLTIAPKLLAELSTDVSALPKVLSAKHACPVMPATINEATFRWSMNADTMATEKLAEGIRNFDTDHMRLVKILSERIVKMEEEGGNSR